MKKVSFRDYFEITLVDKRSNPRYFNGLSATDDIELDNVFSVIDHWRIDSTVYIAKFDQASTDKDKYYVVDGNRRMMMIHLALKCKNVQEIDEYMRDNQLKITKSHKNMLVEFISDVDKKDKLFDILSEMNMILLENEQEVNEVYSRVHLGDDSKMKWNTINRIIYKNNSISWNDQSHRDILTLLLFEYITTDFIADCSELFGDEFKDIEIEQVLDGFKPASTSVATILFKNEFDYDVLNEFDANMLIYKNGEDFIESADLKSKPIIVKHTKGRIFFEKIEYIFRRKIVCALIAVLYSKLSDMSWNTPTTNLYKILENLDYPHKEIILKEFGLEITEKKESNLISIDEVDIKVKDSNISKKYDDNVTDDSKIDLVNSINANRTESLLFFSYAGNTKYLVDFLVNVVFRDMLKISENNLFFCVTDNQNMSNIPTRISSRNKGISEWNLEVLIQAIKTILPSFNTYTFLLLSPSFIIREFPVLEAGHSWLRRGNDNSCSSFVLVNFIDHSKLASLQLPTEDLSNDKALFVFDANSKIVSINEEKVDSLQDMCHTAINFLNKKRELFDYEPFEFRTIEFDELTSKWESYFKENYENIVSDLETCYEDAKKFDEIFKTSS